MAQSNNDMHRSRGAVLIITRNAARRPGENGYLGLITIESEATALPCRNLALHKARYAPAD